MNELQKRGGDLVIKMFPSLAPTEPMVTVSGRVTGTVFVNFVKKILIHQCDRKNCTNY